MTTIKSHHRDTLYQYLRNELIGPGPFGGDNPEESLRGINPINRFPCGVIYPASTEDDFGQTEDDGDFPLPEDDGDDEEGGENTDSETNIIRHFTPPSSFGLSFYVKRESKEKEISLSVNCHAVIYHDARENRNEQYRFKRGDKDDKQLTDVRLPLHEPDKSNKNQAETIDIWKGRARFHIVWRPFKKDGYIVTASLINTQKTDESYSSKQEERKDYAEKSLFEAELEVNIDSGIVMDYPEASKSFIDADQQEIQLQYSSHKIYAIGHGTSADWKKENDEVRNIWTDSMPTTEVPMLSPLNTEDEILNTKYLSGATKPEIIRGLRAFVGDYQKWRDGLDTRLSSFSAEDTKIAERIIRKIDTVIARMHSSIDLLESDEQAFSAFRFMNQAMSRQYRGVFIWRPFQLGFLLTTIESVVHENSEYRDVVDLIWFPTGGGKTEAYLGLSAFLMIIRRLQYPESSTGTTVFMRYTLRLLTSDQFLRASKLILSLELIRQENDCLGDVPFTIGMWVGKATSPNTYHEAHEIIKRAANTGDEPSFILDHCPYCREPFSIKKGNYESTDRSFHFYCKNHDCPFGRTAQPLPCNIVDEALYMTPPSFLVGTVDKFARLAWEPRAKAFFGKDSTVRPPELIIQDELHLITGALGSIVGVYEAGIDTIIKYRGVSPKYIASTATIRSASSQVKALFGRKVAVYPAQGLDADDSYFAKTVPLDKQPGRLYVGYYAPLLNRQECFAPLGATLLSAPPILFGNDQNADVLLDAYWTNIVYHGSLKGLNLSQLSFDTDVRDTLKRLISEKFPKDEDLTEDELLVKRMLRDRVDPKVELLYSNRQAEDIQTVFHQLSVPYPDKKSLDAVLSTNMISVGLDVDRLALMVVNGQPLTTAEYIQASSRVGRKNTPGMVITNFYRNGARNISHYEYFKSYHESFYKFVEPTSVTPWTYQARSRALHASYVLAIRQCLPELEASDFYRDMNKIRKITDIFKKRCAAAAGDLAEATEAHIDRIIEDWENEIKRCEANRRGLVYNDSISTEYEHLLCNFDDTIQGLWPTLQSMRNVEKTGIIKEL